MGIPKSLRSLQPHQKRIFLKLSLASLCIAVVCFIIPGVFGSGYLIQNDHDLLVAVGEFFRADPLTDVMLVITKLGSAAAGLVYCGLAGLYFWFKRRDRLSGLHLLAAWGGAAFFTKAIKEFAQRARPEVLERLGHADGFSFPSGHSLSSGAVFMTLAILALYQTSHLTLRVIVFASALGLTALVAFSRIYLGVHFPSDVIAGSFLGISWALLLGACLTKRHMQANG